MLKITILGDGVSRSLIRHNNGQGKILDEVPTMLVMRISRALAILLMNEILSVEYDEPHFLFIGKEQNYLLDSLTTILRDEIILEIAEAIKLLDWYLGPHIYSPDLNRIGGSLTCSDCHQSQPQAVVSDGFCKNPFCPSHAKWAKVIRDYVPPVSKIRGIISGDTFPILNEAFPKNVAAGVTNDLVKKAFVGLPRNGDSSTWGKKC